MSSCSYCRDDGGRLVRTERLRTKDITQRVKMKNYWQVELWVPCPGACISSISRFHGWLYALRKGPSFHLRNKNHVGDLPIILFGEMWCNSIILFFMDAYAH